MPRSEAMSATAVLANPRRRNSASAQSMMRARVSSGRVLTCVFMTAVHVQVMTDDFFNSSVIRSQDKISPRAGNLTLGRPRGDAAATAIIFMEVQKEQPATAEWRDLPGCLGHA